MRVLCERREELVWYSEGAYGSVDIRDTCFWTQYLERSHGVPPESI